MSWSAHPSCCCSNSVICIHLADASTATALGCCFCCGTDSPGRHSGIWLSWCPGLTTCSPTPCYTVVKHTLYGFPVFWPCPSTLGQCCPCCTAYSYLRLQYLCISLPVCCKVWQCLWQGLLFSQGYMEEAADVAPAMKSLQSKVRIVDNRWLLEGNNKTTLVQGL